MQCQERGIRDYQSEDLLKAWKGGLAEVSRSPKLVRQIERHEGKLLPRFMEQYERLRRLPRRVRRAIQRKWKHSLAGVALLMALGAAPVQASTIINVPAGNEAALIQAINDANSEVPPFDGPDTIVLANSTFILTEVNNTTYGNTGLPAISSEITIDGNGSTIRHIFAPEPDLRIFAVDNSGNLTLQQTTVSGGRGSFGANVFNGGTLTLTNSTISAGNFGYLPFISAGSGVYNKGTLTVTDSTISGNSAPYGSGGGVFNAGTLTITNSTISGNSVFYSDGGGGGVLNGGTLTITNSTISGNFTQGPGGGMANGGGTVTLNRTLVSGNQAIEQGPEIYNDGGTITANNFNLFGYNGDDGLSGFSPGATDIVPAVGISAILDTTLADNGGPTQTHALVSGSPAVDAVTTGCPPPETDQRGVTRPQGIRCDIGAFELQSSPTPTPTQTPTPTSTPTPTPTATPSPGPTNNGSSSGCSIAQSLESGTALANLLIPLLSIFAVGIRYLRRMVGQGLDP